MPSVSTPPPSGPSALDLRTKAAGSLSRECPAAARPTAAHSPHFLHTQPHAARPGPPRTAQSERAPVRAQDPGLCPGLGLLGRGPCCSGDSLRLEWAFTAPVTRGRVTV